MDGVVLTVFGEVYDICDNLEVKFAAIGSIVLPEPGVGSVLYKAIKWLG